MVDIGLGLFNFECWRVSRTSASFRLSRHSITLYQYLCPAKSRRFPLNLVARPCHRRILCSLRTQRLLRLRIRENGLL